MVLPSAPSKDGSAKGSVATEVFECNYETDCPPLYEAIESADSQADYDRIVQFLETGRWQGSFFNMGSSPETQAKTWVTRFDPKDKQKVKWSQLPLHLAIVCGAPTDVVIQLIRLYPQGLRCTDDQHMLPLHLALRHGATDAVIAELVKEFPEAVNAKGKNGRTAVECAHRAKDKSRGVMLEHFVERTKGRISKSVLNERTALKSVIDSKKTEVATLTSELEAQYSVIEKIRGELKAAKSDAEKAIAEKKDLETDLGGKVKTLEQEKEELTKEAKANAEKLESSKLVESLELQKKLEETESAKKHSENAVRVLQDTETTLRKEIELLQAKVNSSVSPQDWNSLKEEVQKLQGERIEFTRDEIRRETVSLQKQCDEHVEQLKTSKHDSKQKMQLKNDMKSIKTKLDGLKTDDASLKTTKELENLRGQLRTIRADLSVWAETSQTLLELDELKKTMEHELRNSKGKTKEEISSLKKAVKGKFESKTAAELSAMKADMEKLKKGMNEKQLFTKTKRDVADLQKSLQKKIADTALVRQKNDLVAVKKTVDALATRVNATNSKEEIIAVSKAIETLKEDMRKREISGKIAEEAANLKESVENEIKNSQGKTQEELVAIKKAIKDIEDHNLDSKNHDELVKIREQLDGVKNELKEVGQATKTQLELAILKKSLEVQMQSTTGKTEKDIDEMKKAVNAINLEHKESKKLKKALGDEIKQANHAIEGELKQLKKNLDSIDLRKIESKSKAEWEKARAEMEALKKEMEEKQVAEVSNSEQQLAAMKKVVEAINVKDIEKDMKEFENIRTEMEALKADIQEKEDDEMALKKAIEDLKMQARQRSKFGNDKAGIKKFLSRRFTKKGSRMKLGTNQSLDSATYDAEVAPLTRVPTFHPPSLSDDVAPSIDDSRSTSDASEQRTLEMVKSKEETPIEAKSPRKPKKGMPPRIPTSVRSSKSVALEMMQVPFKMTRTRSKTHIESDGQVELEAVEHANTFA